MRHSIAWLFASTLTLLAFPALADWDQGVADFRAGRYEAAAEVFSAYVQQQPETPQGHFMLGQCLLQQQRVSEALAALGHAVELDAGNLDYRLALAQVQLKARRAGDALATLAAQDPATVDVRRWPGYENLLANVVDASGTSALAVTTLRRATQAQGDSKVLWQTRAKLAGDAHPEERVDALIRVFEIDRGNAKAGRNAVNAALSLAQKKGQRDPAAWYGKARSIAQTLVSKGGAVEDQILLGEAHLGLDDYGPARQAFEAARAKDADNPYPHYYLGSIALAEEKAAEALGHLAKAEALQAKSDDERFPRLVQVSRASALRHQEQFLAAATLYDQLGLGAKAAEMRGLQEAKESNVKWAEEKKKCEDRRDGIKQLMASSEDLRGTPEWASLEQELDAVLEACNELLADAS